MSETSASNNENCRNESRRYTFGQLLRELTGSESVYVANMREAERLQQKYGSLVSHRMEIQAAVLKWQPDPKTMPGIDRIELICNERFGTGITAEATKRLRAEVCRDSSMDLNAADRLSLEEAADILDRKGTARKSKRSTERGEGQAKLIAALTKHHNYADRSCLNLEPVGNNELARLAGVSESTASAFFNKKFGGHMKYRAICGDTTSLVTALKLMNQEFSPHHLFGAKPPDEDGSKDDE